MIVKNVEKKENNTATFQVEIDKDEFEKAVNAAYLKAKKQIVVPGFRKGKAPRMVVEGMYGADVFYNDAAEDIAPTALAFAVEQEKLEMVGMPSITDMDVSDEKVLTLGFEIALYPAVTLGEYKGLEVEKEKIEITDEAVDAEIDRVRNRNSRIQTVERAAAMGDTAVIDFVGTIDGVAFDGGTGSDFSLKLGSGTFIPGFEEQVVGLSAGEEKDVCVTFPEEYHADLASKDAVFHVTCKEVKETLLPELDDEFAKDVSEFDTLEEYKQSIRTSMEESRKTAADRDFRDAVLTKAAENAEMILPDAMIDEKHERMIEEYGQNLAAQGIPLEQYIGMMGMSMDDFRRTTRPSAERQLRISLMIDEVAKAEEVAVTDEEVEAEYAKVAESYGMPVDDVKNSIPADALRKDMIERKTADLICDSAVAVDPKPVEETEEKEETTEE